MRSLYTIAQEVALQNGENNERNIAKYISFGKNCFRERNLITPVGIISEKLDIDQNTQSAKLPDGYVGYVQVGICIRGFIIQLDYDGSICTFPARDNFCKEEKEIADELTIEDRLASDCGCLYEYGYPCPEGYGPGCEYHAYDNWFNWGPIWYGGQEIKNTYGIPAYRGKHFYKIENGRIWLSGCHVRPEHIVLKYQTTGIKVGEQTLIPELYEQSIIDYMHWKNALLKSKPNTGALFEEYKRQCKVVMQVQAKTDVIEIVRTINSTVGLGQLNR